MRKLFPLSVILCALLLVACGGGAASVHGEVQRAETEGWTQTTQWPDSTLAQQVPRPGAGQVSATTQGQSAGYDFCAVQLTGLTREEIEDYLTALEEAGFSPCGEDAGLELSESGVTVGDLFYREGIYCSVSATDLEEQNSLVIYIAGLAE